MPKKVRKVFGENPEKVTVLSTLVEFDENGEAEVEDEIAEVLEQIPGYVFEGSGEGQQDEEPAEEEPADVEGTDEEPSEEDEEEAPKKPARPARKSPSRK